VEANAAVRNYVNASGRGSRSRIPQRVQPDDVRNRTLSAIGTRQLSALRSLSCPGQQTEAAQVTDLAALANGRDCLIRLPGCLVNRNVVLCHYSLTTTHGMALKSPDTCGAYGCQFCHDVVDGRKFIPGYSKQMVRLALAEAVMRTLKLLDVEGYSLQRVKR
jgi:hypothetical protein